MARRRLCVFCRGLPTFRLVVQGNRETFGVGYDHVNSRNQLFHLILRRRDMQSALHASRRKASNKVIAAVAATIAAATISGFSRSARAADFVWVPTAGGT